MKPKSKLLINVTIFVALFLLSTTTKIAPKTFVNHTAGDKLNYLICKIANTLDETRAPIGEIISTSTTITEPGYYVLTQNIECGIVVDSDDVWIDLNNYQIVDSTGTCTTITINTGHKNILIKNGSLKSTGADSSSSSGILIEEGAQLVNVDSVEIFDFATGIYFDGASSEKIKSCKIKNCTLHANNKGVFGNYFIKSTFEQVEAKNCVEAGFDIYNSDYNIFDTCKALKITNNDVEKGVVGFASTSGRGNLFSECVADGISTTTSNFCKSAKGFWLRGTDELEGETESKIINSIANSISGANYGNAYGIYLDMILRNTTTFNTLNIPLETVDFGSDVQAAAWSPNAEYIAIAGQSYVNIYHFDGTDMILTISKETNGQIVNTVAWSPDGQYLAAGTNASDIANELFLYMFNPNATNNHCNSILAVLDSKELGTNVNSLDWSADGKYLAAGLDNNDSNEIEIWKFDTYQLSDSSVGSNNVGYNVNGVSFSPDDLYLSAIYSHTVELFSFDKLETSNVISSTASINSQIGTLTSIDFSPVACGANYFIAVGGDDNSNQIEIFKFQPGTTISQLEMTSHGTNTTIETIKWSPNGKYLLAAGEQSAGNEISIFSFDASAQLNSRLELEDSGNLPGGNALASDWSPSGRYALIGGQTSGGNDTAIFEVANTPTKCKIEDNNICNITGGLCGIGLSGASGNNLIIKNIAYECDINFNPGTYNTFIGGLLGAPTELDNISVPPYCEKSPTCINFCSPTTICIENLLKCVSATKVGISNTLACCLNLNSKLDIICSEVVSIDSIVDILTEFENNIDDFSQCCATVQSKVSYIDENLSSINDNLCESITESTTISQPGAYCVADNFQGYIIIDSDSVSIDLNGFDICGNINTSTIIQIKNGHKNIVIRNGAIKDAYHGILIEQNASIVKIEDINIFDCQNGLYFDGTSTTTIESCNLKNCNIASCNKAAELNYVSKSVFENCKAYNCTQSGFELNTCSFNVFDKCKTLNLENDDPQKEITGFSSTSGQGNLFTECLVDGLITTTGDFCNCTRGFWFKGTATTSGETESKIINCVIDSIKSAGLANAYGIHLDSTLKNSPLDNLITSSSQNSIILTTDWSAEKDFIAAGGDEKKIGIYSFDGSDLSQVYQTDVLEGEVNSVNWSRNGRFVVAGLSSGDIYVFEFDPVSQTLTETDKKTLSDAIYSVKWSHNTRFIAVGTGKNETEEIQVFGFSGTSFSSLVGYASTTSDVQSIAFSPDDQFLAATLFDSDTLTIYRFEPELIINALHSSVSVSTSDEPTTLDWSPIACSEKYFIALGCQTGNSVQLFDFDGQSSLSLFESFNHTTTVNSVSWSENGKSLLVGALQPIPVRILAFDASADSGSRLQNVDTDETIDQGVFSVSWSPDDSHIVSAGNDSGTQDIIIYNVANVPTNCLIDGNKICNCNDGLCGIGLSGSGSSNLIIKNIGYENDINFSNSIFNIHAEGLHGTPGNLDNISVPPYEGYRGEGIDALIKKLNLLESSIDEYSECQDTIESKIDTVKLKTDDLIGCCDTVFSKVDVINNDLETINSKVDFVKEDIATFDSKIDEFSECYGSVNSSLDAVDDKVDTVDSKIDEAVEGVIQEIDNSISKLDEFELCCTTVESKVDVLLEKSETIESKIDIINLDVEILDTKFDFINSLIDDVDTLILDILYCSSKLDIADDITDTIDSKLDKLIVCCDTVDSKIDEFDSKVDETECTLIGECITTSTTITSPGVYIVCDNFEGYVIIDSNSVYLDLNGFDIYDSSGTGTIVQIKSGNKNISVIDGAVRGGYNGILVEDNAKIVEFSNIRISECTNGILLDGLSTTTLSCCKAKDCIAEACEKGFILHNTIKSCFENCNACNCVQVGFELKNSKLNYFKACKALQTKGANPTKEAIGFYSESGESNIFMGCLANGTEKTNSNFGKNATGFLLKGSKTQEGETKTYIINSIVSETISAGDANAYGINLDATLKTSPLDTTLTTTDSSTTINSVAWSPESSTLALATSSYVKLFEFNGSELTLITSEYFDNQNVYSVAWSPNGEVLMIGTNGDNIGHGLFAYRFYPNATNPSDKLYFLDSIDTGIGVNINSISWNPNGRFVALGLDTNSSSEVQGWAFDTIEFGESQAGSYETGLDVSGVAFSRDGNFLSAVYSTTVNVFEFDLLDASNVLTSKAEIQSQVGSLTSVDFSPTACNSKYFIAVSGDNSTNQVEIFNYDGATTIAQLVSASHGTNVTIKSTKWSPNGNYLLISGEPSSGDEIRILEFNATTPSLTSKATGNLPGGTSFSCDWSPSGQYIVVSGESDSGDDTIIFDVAHVPTKCIIKNNETSASSGGIGGIGLTGASGRNLIVANTSYENNINLGVGVFNQFIEGLHAIQDSGLENISIPPYDL